MSLDVTLRSKEPIKTTCHCCGSEIEEDEILFSSNYTNNVCRMADAAGLYDAVWRPAENNIAIARDLIEPLARGIATMEADPEIYEAFNPSNGWGDYESFLRWLREYRTACESYPDALVSADS